jgi:acetyl-CoA acetyltransferase
MKFLRDKSIAIIGYADTKIERRSGRSALSLGAEVLNKLVDRTGVARREIDGLAVTWAWSDLGNPFWTNYVADSLGLAPAWSQVTDIGGASATGNIARAAAAIHAGACEVALCLAADAPSTQQQFRQTGFQTEFCEPFGYSGPPVVFGLLSSAYHARYGLPERALAKLAVAQRNGALLNPHACETLRVPLTEEDYLRSRMIADPIRLLDCVMRCDGANGFLVTSTERARKLGARMLHPVAYREVIDFDPALTIDDITVSGFAAVGPAALADAGVTPADVRMFQPYDDFLIAVILQLEQIGFAPPGGGGEFILDHDIGFAGDFPINTGGGQISAGQAGLAGGGVNLVEAVQQLYGEAGERQVRGARNALVTGIGSMQYARNWGTSAALVLEAA